MHPLFHSKNPLGFIKLLLTYKIILVISLLVSQSQVVPNLYDINKHLSYVNISTSHKIFALATSVEIGLDFFHQVVTSKAWQAAMDKEISALELNHTWDIALLPIGKTPIGCKWIYRIKYNPIV